MQHLKLFTGNANVALARDVAQYLSVDLAKAEVGTFSDGEVNVEIHENVRGMDCFVLQSTSAPANTHLMELLIMVDALRRASARRVTAVIPYYGYARQDRKVRPRMPISAKLVADLIVTARTDRVLCLDLHAGQIQGFFNIPVDNLFATPILLDAIRSRVNDPICIISPDAGGVERARAIAKRLGASLAIVDKRRTAPNKAEVMNVIGEVAGATTLIIDDIIDTAGTLVNTVEALVEKGAKRVLAVGVHAVLSGPALERLETSSLERVLVTNTTPLEDKLRRCSKLQPLSVASLLGEAIRRIHDHSSVSSLFV
jgi:ribose-phosphate pyrophosphokinase